MALYKRRIYLINKPFQLKFSLYLALIVLISSALYPVLIYEVYSSVAQTISQEFPQAAQNFNQKKSSLILALLALQLSFSILFFIIGIFLSHKIAGPLHKLQLFLKAAARGEEHGILSFRNGDYFSEIADQYNETINELTGRRLNAKQELEQLSEEIKQSRDLDSQLIVERLKQSIENI